MKKKRRQSKEHSAWHRLKARCYDENHIGYPNYGGRGIKVCERWKKSFVYFLLDMGKAPTPKHSIDRIDNNGNYEPANCRWATHQEQQNNRRDSKIVVVNGQSKTLAQWCAISNIKYSTAWRRLSILNHTPESVFNITQ